jgi:hypothetical protein
LPRYTTGSQRFDTADPNVLEHSVAENNGPIGPSNGPKHDLPSFSLMGGFGLANPGATDRGLIIDRCPWFRPPLFELVGI